MYIIQKLNNPKVEKAEILESVVDFVKLEIESYSVKRKLSRDPTEEGSSPPCKRRHPYSEGMRSCLLRVGEFISTKSKPMENEERATGSPREGSPSPRASISCKDNSAPIHNTYVGDLTLSSLLAAHRSKNLDQNEAHHITKRFSSEQKCVAVDPVWRPWPQWWPPHVFAAPVGALSWIVAMGSIVNMYTRVELYRGLCTVFFLPVEIIYPSEWGLLSHPKIVYFLYRPFLFFPIFWSNPAVQCFWPLAVESFMKFLHEMVLFRLYLGLCSDPCPMDFFFLSINLFSCLQACVVKVLKSQHT